MTKKRAVSPKSAIKPPRMPAGKPVRVVDIAERVGISSRVVAKVLFPESSNSARVGKVTAEKVRAVAAELGYRPNLTARQLAGAQSRIIGVLMQSFVAEISYKVLAHLEQYASAKGYRLIVGQLNGDAELTSQFVEDFAGRGLDGVICFAHEDPRLLKKFMELSCSVKNILFVGCPTIPGHDWVGSDLARGIKSAVRHLYETGRRRIALLQPESVLAPFRERVKGFHSILKTLKLHSKDCPAWLFEPGGETRTQQYQVYGAVEQLLASHPLTDAIVAENDLSAMYVLQYLHMRSIAVPGQIAVTGFDNLDMAEATIPPLTSVDQCPRRVAHEIIEMIVRRKTTPNLPVQSVKIAPNLVVRGSSSLSD